jgi:G3E family GTPase
MKIAPFILVTGFLGSGKTTLLKRIIARHADTMKLAVIQNEFAQVGVDARELRETGKTFEIMEINRGSVFCVCLLSDFIGSLSDLLDAHRPDAVVLEATGLADPIAVAQLVSDKKLNGKTYLHRVFCIVDASTFLRMERQVGRIAHQVRVADCVLINKIDCEAVNVAQVRSRIGQINPFARLLEVTRCEMDLSGLFENGTNEPVAARHDTEKENIAAGGRPDVGSAVIRSAQPLSLDQLRAFCGSMENRCWRMKGHVRFDTGMHAAIQSCFGDTEIKPVAPFNGPGEIVCIGPGITQQQTQEAFEAARGMAVAKYIDRNGV